MNCVFCGPVKNCAPFLDKVYPILKKLVHYLRIMLLYFFMMIHLIIHYKN